MSFALPSSINLIDYSGRPWSDINFTEKDGGSSPQKSSSPKEYTATRLLPRCDRPLFGQFPKLDTKVLLECDKCGKVLLRSAFNAHCSTPEHRSMQPIVPPPVVAPAPPKAATRNRKAATKPLASGGVVLIATPPPPPTPALPAVGAAASNGRASKHKKSAKSNKRSRKEEKPELLQPAAAAAELPAKVVKQDIDHVVAVLPSVAPTAASPASIPPSHAFNINIAPEVPDDFEADATRQFVEVCVKEEEDIATSVATHSVGVALRPPPAFIESSPTPNHVISVSTPDPELPPVVSIKEEASPAPAATVSNENDDEQASSPVDHMPMSPVAVVNIVPVQNYQYLHQYLQLPTQPIVVTIPCTSPSTHMYSYPKPLTVATRAIRRLGNTYLLQNQRMDHQRAEIQAILRSRQELNHLPT